MSDYFEHIEESRQKQLAEAKKRIEVLEEVIKNLCPISFSHENDFPFWRQRKIDEAKQQLKEEE